MAFRDNVAAGRKDPNGSTLAFASDKPSTPASNQAQFGSKDNSTPAITVGKYNEGHLVSFAANTKNTGTRGVPTALSVGSKDRSLGAVENPDGVSSRPKG